jgi:nitroimidazol reductase NimA-like FMN-containing flavoprotein (pyridoxamine 5'-phosphate oxidase superfamily)
MDPIKDQIVEYLSRRKFLTLATITQKGNPLTHPLAYVNKGATLYVSTGIQTRKFKNINENPNVAYSVYDPSEYLDEIISVQMEGKANLVTDEKEIDEVFEMLKKKFPSMDFLNRGPESIVIKIDPKICYFTDYTKGSGRIDKIEF